MSFFYILLGFIVLVVIGGFRDKTVGRDTTFYAEEIFKDAVDFHSLVDYIEWTTRAEVGYAIVNYIVSIFTDKLQWALFAFQFLTALFLLLAIYEAKCERYAFPIMFLYIFYFYNNSLTMMRQALAMNCFILSYACYLNAKALKTICFLIVGFLFHKSILFGIFLVAFVEVVMKLELKYKIIVCLVAVFITLVIVSNLETIILSFATVEMFENYQHYTGDEMGEGSNKTEMLVRFVLLVIIIYARNCNYLSNKDAGVYILFLLMEIFFFSLSVYSMYLYRVGFYVGILELLYIPRVLDSVTVKFDRIILKSVVFSLVFFQWYWLYVKNGIGETLPYTSEMLGINF